MKIHPNTPNNIGIEFKVWAPKLTRVTKRLYLLGSLKELGAWNIDKALKAFPTTDMHIWTVEASIPALCHFEWVWLTTNLNRMEVEWEKSTKRNRTVDCFSGTIHTIWGDADEVFLQTATCLEVTTYVRVEEGFTLVLTGSTPSTGEWNLHYAKPATEFPKRSGYWKINVAFDALTNLEFKWAIVKEKEQGVLRVQEKLPHSIFGRKSWMRAVAPWKSPMVIVVDTSLLCDMTDTMLGRTDMIVMARKKRAEEIKTWLLTSDESKAVTTSTKLLQRPSPIEKPASMEYLSTQVQPDRPGTMVPPTPTFSSTNVTSSERAPSLDEHIKNREEMSKSERQTQKIYKKFSEESTVFAIKGAGQKLVATDRMNIGDLPVDATEMNSRRYGEVAEITSEHVPACFTSKRQKRRYLSWEKPEPQSDEMLTRQHDEELINISIPEEKVNSTQKAHLSRGGTLSQEGVGVQEKGVVFSDNDSNEEDITLIIVDKDVVPVCVKSQNAVPDVVYSDTGFTEMSSWMSSLKTDLTCCSESAISSSHTMTCVLAGDINNASDGEDSRSDTIAYQSCTVGPVNEGMVSYWESQQRDLNPPWLDKARTYFECGRGDLLADTLAANEEDDEHLEWMATRGEDDNHSVITDWSGVDINNDYFSTEKCSIFGDGKEKPGLDNRNDSTKWRQSSPPRSLQMKSSSLKFTHINEIGGSSQSDSTERSAPFISDFDYLYDSDLTPYASMSTSLDKTEFAQRRRAARDLEEQWGASSRATEGQQTKSILKTKLPSLKKMNDHQSFVSAFADEFRGLISSEGKSYKMTYYSCSELSDMLVPETDYINHREKAREIERMWGESQMNNSWIGNDIDTSANLYSNNQLICESVPV